MAAVCHGARKRADERQIVDGQVVWSWHPDAGVKSAPMPSGIAWMTGANKPGPRGEREAAEKPTAQGMPDDRLNLWYLPPAFFSAGGPWVKPSPGIPCALFE
ncbi:hypothetical protein ACQR16_12770 [Bradyrhizobium oligotrophicum]|uniref:hypothetical protein n=1 Tax=Bradyrhizobium oligotrophicum TaxID=44255 RepID=UPI003EB80AB0